MDPTYDLLQEVAEQGRRAKDQELATPQQDPSSPFLSPPSTTNSLCVMNSNQQAMTSDETIKRLAIKSQDADHRRRFERFLNVKGIIRRPLRSYSTTERLTGLVNRLVEATEFRTGRVGYNSSQGIRENIYDEFPDVLNDCGLNEGDEDEAALTEGHEDLDHFYDSHYASESASRYKQPEDIDAIGNDDSGYLYMASSVGQMPYRPQPTLPPLLPKDANDSYDHWEVTPKRRRKERKQTTDSLYSRKVLTHDIAGAVDVNYVAKTSLNLERGKKFKNNLTCFSSKYKVIFIVMNSEVSCYKIGDDFAPIKPPLMQLETKPNLTIARDRERATWPFLPYMINFAKVDTFNDREVLAVTCDDSRVLIWYVDTIMDHVTKYNEFLREKTPFGFSIEADFQIRMLLSAWSIDFYNEFNLIAISDNSQTVTLFHYDTRLNILQHTSSHPVLHNIPDVSFIKTSVDDYKMSSEGFTKVTVQLACASISCELIIFEFRLSKLHGPFKPDSVRHGPVHYDVEIEESAVNVGQPENLQSIIFGEDHPVVVSRTILIEDVWTVNYVDGKYFMEVDTPEEMSISPDDFNRLAANSIRENEVMDTESDPCITSDLGFAAKISHLSIPPAFGIERPRFGKKTELSSTTDRFRRIRKMFDSYYLEKKRSRQKQHQSWNGKQYWEPIISTKRNNQFLCVTTSSRAGLYNAEKLLCVASSGYSLCPQNDSEESAYLNRLSLYCVIPELSCIIFVSQIGLGCIFRLCKYRGVHTMRFETILPLMMKVSLLERRIVSGVCANKLGTTGIDSHLKPPRYALYLTTLSGDVYTYILEDSVGSLDVSDPI